MEYHLDRSHPAVSIEISPIEINRFNQEDLVIKELPWLNLLELFVTSGWVAHVQSHLF